MWQADSSADAIVDARFCTLDGPVDSRSQTLFAMNELWVFAGPGPLSALVVLGASITLHCGVTGSLHGFLLEEKHFKGCSSVRNTVGETPLPTWLPLGKGAPTWQESSNSQTRVEAPEGAGCRAAS